METLRSLHPPQLSRRRTSVVDDEHEPLLGRHQTGYDSTEAFWPGEESEHISEPNMACSIFPVYHTIHKFRKDVVACIDDPYSAEQLRSPRMNRRVLRPMVDKYYDMDDLSVVYCILVNRVQFLREQSENPHHFTVANTRAMLCEIVASRILRRFDDNNAGPKGLLLLAHILVAGFDPFQNAAERTIQEHSNLAVTPSSRKTARPLTTLEVAIISGSKTFLSTVACQKVVDAIYQGQVIYTPTTFLDVLPDRYKQRPITLYDPMQAPLLNQYRLIVPRTRALMEITQFVVLLILYVCVMNEQLYSDISRLELFFDIYAWGWILDQTASVMEHGWHVYTQNLWAFLDVIFELIYVMYFVMRMHAHATGDEEMAELAFSILSSAAPVLIPRLAFNVMSENLLFLSLRAMMSDFTILTLLAVWCFAGFLLALDWLAHEQHPPLTIAKWMLYVWFGLDGSGVEHSVDFHWLLGPILIVLFAFLGNTLFLTILVSMLSNTFSKIAQNASAEIQFRRAVLTFECVKSDAIFAFYPPFNLFALLVLSPLRLVVTPRWFHKIVVLIVRVINAPWLLLIGWIERRALWASKNRHLLKPRKWPWDMSRLAVHRDIQTVFEADPPDSIIGTPKVETDEDDRAADRRTLIAPIEELTSQLQKILKDHGNELHKPRLEALESAMSRVEKHLETLVGRTANGKASKDDESDENADT